MVLIYPDGPDSEDITTVGVEYNEALNEMFYVCPICERFHSTSGLYDNAETICKTHDVKMKVLTISESEVI